MAQPLPENVGPFRVERLLGRGGMASVYAAVHHETNQRAALKVLSPSKASMRHIGFQNEILALSRIRHPRIAAILDAGLCPQHGPWYAMELFEGPSLHQSGAYETWPKIQQILSDLLSALSHAHARGLIHRDLKPNNILHVCEPSGSYRIKLIDFGLVFEPGSQQDRLEQNAPSIVGTPKFMAPEQIRATITWQGPWTDLYAVGVLAWWMLTGETPFERSSLEETLRAHLRGEKILFRPRVHVPPGVTSWLRQMLESDPRHRYHNAAQAMRELQYHVFALGQGDTEGIEEVELSQELISFGPWTLPEPHSDPTVPLSLGDEPTDWPEQQDASFSSSRQSTNVPPTCFDTSDIHYRPQGDKSSLALLRMRPCPTIGRDEEREVLWSSLREVWETRSARLCLLHAPAGAGTTHLAQWIARRARELGCASTWVVSHANEPTGTHGLTSAVRRLLRVRARRPSASLEEHIRHVLEGPDFAHDSWSASQVTSLAAWCEEGDEVPWEQRRDVLLDLMGNLATHRPLIWVCDDLALGPDTLEVLDQLLKVRADIPVLIVATTSVSPTEHIMLRRLLRLESSRRLDLRNLASDEMFALCKELLDMEPRLEAWLVAHAQGNPARAIDLLFELAENRALRSSPQGYRVLQKSTITFDWLDPLAMLETRWGRAEPRASQVLPVLELVAAFGACTTPAFEAACAHAGVGDAQDLARTLVVQGVLHLQDDTYTLTSPELTRALLTQAQLHRRLRPLHRWCADWYGDASIPGANMRQAHHLLEAHEFEQAHDILLQEAFLAPRQGAYARSVSAMERCIRLLPSFTPPEELPSVLLKRQLQLAHIILTCFLHDDLLELLEHIQPSLLENSDPELHARWVFLRIMLYSVQGEHRELVAFYERERPLTLNRLFGVYCLRQYAHTLAQLRRFEEATAAIEQTHEIYLEFDELVNRGTVYYSWAEIALMQRDFATCERMLLKAIAYNEESFVLELQTAFAIMRSLYLLIQGDLEAAEQTLRELQPQIYELRPVTRVLYWLHEMLLCLAGGRHASIPALYEAMLQERLVMEDIERLTMQGAHMIVLTLSEEHHALTKLLPEFEQSFAGEDHISPPIGLLCKHIAAMVHKQGHHSLSTRFDELARLAWP